MRIGIQTWGSDGDIRPMIALAGGLRAAGHEVDIAVTSVDDTDYSALGRALGLEITNVVERMGLDLPALAREATRLRNALRLPYLFFHETFFPWQERMLEVAKAQCERCDVAVGHFLMYPMRAAAERRGLPYCSVTLCHGIVPTAHAPLMRLPDLGARLNPLGWKLAAWLFDTALKSAVDKMWRREGLRPKAHVLPDVMYSDGLNLVAVSNVFVRDAPDWTAHRTCGYFAVPESAEPFRMPAALEEFLSNGEAPVYMTLGTSGKLIPDIGTQLLIKAARLARVRAIVQTRSPRYPRDVAHDGVYSIGHVPHHAVFPRCVAVVHHGGAGTTHSATRAGRPSVVLPFMGEQDFWGRELRRLGVAGAPLSIRLASPKRLAARLRRVLDDDSIRRRAEEVGREMATEDGVSRAVEMIERFAVARNTK